MIGLTVDGANDMCIDCGIASNLVMDEPVVKGAVSGSEIKKYFREYKDHVRECLR